MVDGDTRTQARPALAEIAGAIDVRTTIVRLVARDCRISRRGVVRRSFDAVDPAEFRQVRRCDVGPVHPAVHRHVDEAVVGPRPQSALGAWRFGDREDRPIVVGAAVVARDLPTHGALSGLVISRQIGADRRPGLALARGLEQHVCRRVQRARSCGDVRIGNDHWNRYLTSFAGRPPGDSGQIEMFRVCPVR